MSSTRPVTGSDDSHPPVTVKPSEAEQQRIQQADAKLQDYVKQGQSKVFSVISVNGHVAVWSLPCRALSLRDSLPIVQDVLGQSEQAPTATTQREGHL